MNTHTNTDTMDWDNYIASLKYHLNAASRMTNKLALQGERDLSMQHADTASALARVLVNLGELPKSAR
jgi:hypothetical protein